MTRGNLQHTETLIWMTWWPRSAFSHSSIAIISPEKFSEETWYITLDDVHRSLLKVIPDNSLSTFYGKIESRIPFLTVPTSNRYLSATACIPAGIFPIIDSDTFPVKMKRRISLNRTGSRSLTSNWWVKFYLFFSHWVLLVANDHCCWMISHRNPTFLIVW